MRIAVYAQGFEVFLEIKPCIPLAWEDMFEALS